ncbi:MAG TPA: gliding motility-associated C-terminal domain-containing protein [Saprospiraceae bacterium]|nr:gliding motility-associated C-terminal domain-containing protein [Saprospiraceae bacterium]
MSPRLKPYFCLASLAIFALLLFTISSSAGNIFSNDRNEIYSPFHEPCPPATLNIHQPGWICQDGNPFQMTLTPVGLNGNLTITWSGQAIMSADGWFDPNLGFPGLNMVYVEVVQDSCVYFDSLGVLILMKEITSFELSGTPCKDSTIQLNFNGFAYGSSDWHYDFDGAEFEQIEWPDDYKLRWSEPGLYYVSLWTERLGCTSDTFVLPVIIGQYLEPPQLVCVKEDYYSLEISWQPVEGASGYIVITPFSTDTISATHFYLEQLPDNTTVNFEVTALQPGGCGPGETSSIQCTTLKYIAPAIYVPNIFSPNNDGFNDLIFVQSNEQVTQVSFFKVFDRWGNMIYEKENFPPNDQAYGWNGNISGKVPNPQVFVYKAELQTVYGDAIQLSGDITLVK